MLHKNNISSQQKQDDPAQKNILCSKKLLIFIGTARHTYALIRTRTEEVLVFQKILGTY